MSWAIRIEGLTKTYDGFVLDRVSFDIPVGTVVGLLGQNGAGKSTLIKCLLKLVKSDAGEVSFPCVEQIREDADIRLSVGYIPEQLTLYEWMTVERLIRFVSSFYPTWDHLHCRNLLVRYDLNPQKTISHLSKGMRAKLALLLALAHRPPVLVLDEPTSGLDPVMKSQFLAEVRDAVRSGETKAVLVSSHILGEVEAIADRVAVLKSGVLSCYSEAEALLADWRKITFSSVTGSIGSIQTGAQVITGPKGNSLVVPAIRAAELLEAFKGQGATDIRVSEPELQEVFLSLI